MNETESIRKRVKYRKLNNNKITINMFKNIKNIYNIIKYNIIINLILIILINNVDCKNNANNQKENNLDIKINRNGKSLFFNNPMTDLYFNNYQTEVDTEIEDYNDDEVMGRSRIGGNNKKKVDSPIYYIRLPPSPYVHVPGYGYVSDSTNLKPPPHIVESTQKPNNYQNKYQTNQNNNKYNSQKYETNFQNQNTNYMSNNMNIPNYMQNNYMQQQNYMNHLSNQQTSSYYPQYQEDYNVYPASTFPLNEINPQYNFGNQYKNSPIYNLPLQFLANGKPSHIYTLDNEIQNNPIIKPNKPLTNIPDSPIYHLDKGPYVFNGKPSNDVIILNDAYNTLYDETINNFYP